MPLSQEQINSLPQEVKDLIRAARFMPRSTPAPGAASTIHSFKISAGTVWALDKALINLGFPHNDDYVAQVQRGHVGSGEDPCFGGREGAMDLV